MKTLIFASHNENKTTEIRRLLAGKFDVRSLEDLDYHEAIAETGETFQENALIKARTIYDQFSLPCIADDSGLEVEALNGAPGVRSARFAGEPSDDKANNQLLLEKLLQESNRNAQFKTVLAFIDEEGKEHTFTGIVRGRLLTELTGDQGFGYDPLFVPDGFDRTFAQMSKDEKNQISHRGIAIQEWIAYISNR